MTVKQQGSGHEYSKQERRPLQEYALRHPVGEHPHHSASDYLDEERRGRLERRRCLGSNHLRCGGFDRFDDSNIIIILDPVALIVIRHGDSHSIDLHVDFNGQLDQVHNIDHHAREDTCLMIAESSQELLDRHGPSTAQILAPLTAVVVVAMSLLVTADSSTTWYIIRSTGVIAYVLLALSVIAGLLISQRAAPAGRTRLDLFEMHAFLSLVAIAFGSIHAVALLFDQYMGFTPKQILVPFTSSYRSLSVGLGVISLYAAILIYVSFWAKRYIGYKRWRALHFATFAVFLLVTLHGYFSGADSRETWMFAIYTFATIFVIALTTMRFASARASRQRRAATVPA